MEERKEGGKGRRKDGREGGEKLGRRKREGGRKKGVCLFGLFVIVKRR